MPSLLKIHTLKVQVGRRTASHLKRHEDREDVFEVTDSRRRDSPSVWMAREIFLDHIIRSRRRSRNGSFTARLCVLRGKVARNDEINRLAEAWTRVMIARGCE